MRPVPVPGSGTPHGAALRDWQRRRAVSRRAKCLALGLMAASWGLIWWLADGLLLPVMTGCLLAGVGGYLATRPEPVVCGPDRCVITPACLLPAMLSEALDAFNRTLDGYRWPISSLRRSPVN